MQRGTILQYSQEQGCGRVVSEGTQFSFNIQQWKSNSAPAVNRIVEVEVREFELVSIAEVPESVLLREKGGEAAGQVRKLGELGLRYWHKLVAGAGMVTVIAQIVYAISLFGLPVATLHLLWFQGSASLYEFLSNPLINMPGLYMLCLYLSCVVILLPVAVKNKKSWLALFLPLVLLVIVGYEVYSKIREMTADDNLFGNMAVEGVKQLIHFDIGIYLIAASALVLPIQGLRKFVVCS